MNRVIPWIRAARLHTLPLAASCVLIGGALSLSSGLDSDATDRFPWMFGGALLTVVLLQVLSNFANDYGDFQQGTDTRADRQDRALASGAIAPQAMKRALIGVAVLAFATGLATLFLSFGQRLMEEWRAALLIAMGIASIAAALKYTLGSNPFGYQGLGDLFVLIFFGFVGVMGVGLLTSHAMDWTWAWASLFSGCMSMAVLNLNNLRDHVHDEQSGKKTLVVRLGFRGGKVYHLALLTIGWLALALHFSMASSPWHGTFWYALIALVHARHAVEVWRCQEPKSLNPELKRIALSTFVVALFMFMDQMWS